ncbi:MAG TPA: hypothetical protein VLE47_03815 [Candidatus Saccharimonadales bacterium]|nr:hypothetical protein [Candidatus Saccharimonadales bacterium]
MDQVEEVIARFEERIKKQVDDLKHALFKLPSTYQMVEVCLEARSLCKRQNLKYFAFPICTIASEVGYVVIFFPEEDKEFERRLDSRWGEWRIGTNEVGEQVESIRSDFFKFLRNFLTGQRPVKIGERIIVYSPN